MIYQPTRTRINQAAGDLRQRHADNPEMLKRIEKAVDLVDSRSVDIQNDGRFVVWSQSSTSTRYLVSYGCECADYSNGAPVIKGSPFCKHRIAVSLYKQILAEEINKRIIGNGERANRLKCEARQNCYLMIIPGGRGQDPGLRSETLGSIGSVRLQRRLYRPATGLDALKLAEWLHQAQPLPELEPLDDVYMQSAHTSPPAMTVEEYQHWLRTGDTPAMRKFL
jgi:hypothetical protein